jgi:hypothetical protein
MYGRRLYGDGVTLMTVMTTADTTTAADTVTDPVRRFLIQVPAAAAIMGATGKTEQMRQGN